MVLIWIFREPVIIILIYIMGVNLFFFNAVIDNGNSVGLSRSKEVELVVFIWDWQQFNTPIKSEVCLNSFPGWVIIISQ